MAKRLRLSKSFPALEWLEEASSQQPRLTLAGGRRAMVENHTGIAEFTDARIRIETRAGVMTFSGEELLLTELRSDQLTVRGRIRVIELPEGGE